MRYLSLFSGVEAASLAWKPLGWEAVAFAEVNPFASAVLAHRFPETPNLGDVCKIGEAELGKLGHIDVIIFGSPCQDFSIAGKREGMDDADGERTRSGLFHEAIRIVRLASRINGCGWFIMENVPGMLSCRGGRDFAEIVREISGCSFSVPGDGWRNAGVVKGIDGGWSAACRTLDARFFGVPQRRRRVFVVGRLGNWTDPASLLFVGESLSRNPPTSRKTRSDVARSLKGGARGGGGQSSSDGQETLIPEVAFAVQTQDRRAAQGWNTTLLAFDCKAGGNTGHAVDIYAGALRGEGDGSAAQRAGLGIVEDASPAIRARPNNAVAHHGVRRLTPIETERLQGMPDDHSRIPYGRKSAEDCPDSNRYMCIGNSFAVPVIRWLGERLQQVKEKDGVAL